MLLLLFGGVASSVPASFELSMWLNLFAKIYGKCVFLTFSCFCSLFLQQKRYVLFVCCVIPLSFQLTSLETRKKKGQAKKGQTKQREKLEFVGKNVHHMYTMSV